MNKTSIKAEIIGKDTNIIVEQYGVKTMYRIYDFQDKAEAIRLLKINSHRVEFVGSFAWCY